jgi:hypothetical protein
MQMRRWRKEEGVEDGCSLDRERSAESEGVAMRGRVAKGLMVGAMVGVFSGSVAGAAELKVGDQAPTFTLKASDGKTYSLEQFRGEKPVILAWFPKAFTGG